MADQPNGKEHRIFNTEEEFLAAEPSYTGDNGKSQGFLVTVPGEGTAGNKKQYWVWASNRDHAVSLVARYHGLASCITYRRLRAVATPPVTESEVLALFSRLSQDLQDKVRRHLNGHTCPFCPTKVDKRSDLTAHIRTKHPAQAK